MQRRANRETGRQTARETVAETDRRQAVSLVLGCILQPFRVSEWVILVSSWLWGNRSNGNHSQRHLLLSKRTMRMHRYLCSDFLIWICSTLLHPERKLLQEERTCDATGVTRLDSTSSSCGCCCCNGCAKILWQVQARVADSEVNKTVRQREVCCNYCKREKGNFYYKNGGLLSL